MHTDFAVVTGSHHAVTPCQDYCLAWHQDGRAGAVIADGCSTGSRTDLGARIWALAAQTVLSQAGDEFLCPDALREALCREAEPWLRRLAPSDGLATLTTVQAVGRKLRVCMFGDGAVVTRYTDGRIELRNRLVGGNAPFYLNYHLHPALLEQYRTTYANAESNLTWQEFDADGQMTRVGVGEYANEDVIVHDLDADRDDIDLLLVATDGLGTGPGLFQAAHELAAIKGSQGEFLKRRVGRIVRDWQKAGTMPSDDLAVAGIWLGEQEKSHG